MIGIKAIASYIPETVRDNYQQAKSLGEKPSFIDNKIGAISLPIMNEGDDTSDLAVSAVRKLLEENNLSAEQIDCLVIVTQNPDGNGLPHTSAIVHNKLGLSKKVAAFDLSLGCSGYVYGLTVIKGFMEMANLKCGILVTVDPYSKIINPEDKNTTLLFGDAATATLLDDKPKLSLGRSIFATDGSGANNLQVKQNVLHMNGRQVFNFAAIEVPKQIAMLLKSEGIESTDIDCYILHQGSKFIVKTISSQFEEVSSRFLCDIEKTGNTVSSSIPLLLEKIIADMNINTILISGFGVGLSWASMILKRH
ncbi:3-oxoacyl-(acyl-carrier-protein) synthase III [Candidatus Thiomargarita nelsonii]|uniref:3-oxoacyl-(Acyl-carrier-protein) synthase III n=1 Tax=Candidatus Thiomargarita nelsonii TaxID=1003181 RepID=A0A176S487_9GAMM|nr:3-oxoacyl-(acyl-carrier-protein) synthase III [Candidatus Thiomargarita nelsonii]